MAGTYNFEYYCTVGIWVKRSGAWQKVTNAQAGATLFNTTSGSHTVGWTLVGTFQLGSGVQAFGVTIEGYTGTGATVDDLAGVSWTTQSTSGVRTALPSGALTTVTVRPK